MRATRASIHLDNLQWNIKLVRGHIGPETAICLAVKADAYGHGAVEVSNTALSSGVSHLAVATVDEGIILRKSGITAPIILLSIPIPEEIDEISKHGFIPLAAGREYIEALEDSARKTGKTITVHLKIDTGMGRIGNLPEAAAVESEYIDKSGSLILGGVSTHFPAADSSDKGFTENQIEVFRYSVELIRKKGIDPGIVHAANSGAIVQYPEARFDMVRPGIIAYGYYPSTEQKRILDVRPVMEFESRIVFLKRVKKGTPVSYGMTYKTQSDTMIGTIPAGYGDGYNRLLSGKGRVLIKNRLYPVAGRVCMDQFMVDLGPDTDVRLYDKATLFGPDPEGPDAEEIALLTGTIPYEVTCNINKRVPRFFVR